MDFGVDSPRLGFLSAPLVEGTLVVDKSQLDLKMLDPTITITEYAAIPPRAVDHLTDALRYGMSALSMSPAIKGDFPDPPATPEGLTPEQHAAHLMIHDLMTVEEFEAERAKPGFVAINAHWGANGKRRFCCERPMALKHLGEFSSTGLAVTGSLSVSGPHFFRSVELNDAWMAKIETSALTETAQVSQSAWDKLKSLLAKK